MIVDMRWVITWIALVMLLAFTALAVALASRQSSGSPQETRFLQWETCVLNDGPRCGPQPVP